MSTEATTVIVPGTAPAVKTKILLVDNDELVQIYFKDIFWIHGLDDKYDIEVVGDIDKAEEIIKNPQTRPRAVFLDLIMPMRKGPRIEDTAEAGISLLKKIKDDPELKSIKVFIFSGYTNETYKDIAKKLGAEDFIVKGQSLPQDLVTYIGEKLK
ncbi:response regulator [Candidatus Wolfebacteria bacterium]|nr:response regulator [Candidatus Wolfebacteria bacterium]